MPTERAEPSPARIRWLLVLAFAAVYLSWGTTYLAIKVGVRSLPPALFGGVRLSLAGLLLLTYLGLTGSPLRLPGRELVGAALTGAFFFIGGNGLISFGQQSVDSAVAAVLVASTPLWIALLENVWPGGDRLGWGGWGGLLLGLAGVLLLLGPQLHQPARLLDDAGTLLVLSSAFCWAIGSLLSRYLKRSGSPLLTAGYQMLLGGGGLTLVGVALGEVGELTPSAFQPDAVFAFFYLLFVGSLVGFVAYTFLLGRVSAALAGTYAYVNPLVAILVGWLLGNEPITGWLLGGMVVILVGVGLVRGGSQHRLLDHTATSCAASLPLPDPTQTPPSSLK